MSEKTLKTLEVRIPSKCPNRTLNYISFGKKICQPSFAFQCLFDLKITLSLCYSLVLNL
jgi:hypothetical protein